MSNEKIKSIECFIESHLKDASEYCKTEARILNSFLLRLMKDGGALVYIHDGEDRHDIQNNDRFFALYHIFSVDYSTLRIITPDGRPANLYLLIGEGEAQTIYDTAFHKDSAGTIEDNIFKVWSESVKTHSPALYAEYW